MDKKEFLAKLEELVQKSNESIADQTAPELNAPMGDTEITMKSFMSATLDDFVDFCKEDKWWMI